MGLYTSSEDVYRLCLRFILLYVLQFLFFIWLSSSNIVFSIINLIVYESI